MSGVLPGARHFQNTGFFIVMLCSRPATPVDESLLFRLFAEDRVAALASCGVGDAEKLVEMQYRGQRMTYTARYPQAEDLILLAGNGTPAGRVLLHRRPECWRIVDIAILPDYRGRGLAARAIEACQNECRRAGARLELQVEPLSPARRLYERLGFRLTVETEMSVEMVWGADQPS